MGFFDIFTGKKQEAAVTLKLEDIEGYIISDINLKTASSKKIEQSYDKLSKELESARSNLNMLAIADIKDKVPDKARVRVLGNRDAYVKSLQLFIQSIHVPDVVDQEIALNFCNDLNSNLNKFGESTKKNFYISEQLFGIELDKVNQNLRAISTILNLLKEELEKEDVIIIKNLRQRVSSLREKRSKLSDLGIRVNDLEKKLSPFISARNQVEEDVKKMKSSKEYEIYEKLSKDKAALERKIKGLEHDVLEIFSQLSKIIKKYNKNKKIKLLDSYVESPFEALLQDLSLEITQHLKDVEKEINSDEVQLKGKAKEKMLKIISILTPQYLTNVSSQYAELKSQFMGIKSRMFSSRLAEEEMRLSSRLDSINSNIKLYESDIQQLKKIKGKIDIDEDKRVITHLLAKLTNKEFTIMLE